MVDTTFDHKVLNFLNAFFYYNQISMDLNDKEKTLFVIAIGTYCNCVMPFVMKNLEATY